MRDDVTLTLNFVESRSATPIANPTKKAITMAIGGVGFNIATRKKDQLAKNLYRDFGPVVERELQDMAKKVASIGVGINGGLDRPSGTLAINGRISQAMIGNSGPMSIGSVTGKWAERSSLYMKYKLRKHRTRKWFTNTGKLQKSLGNSGTYTRAYGAMKLVFKPAPFTKGSIISSLGRSSGGQSPTAITLGRIEISPLRNLRVNDLPGIGQQANYSERLMGRLPDSIRRKLSGRKGKYRPVIEPFLTYYINRKIPNAVFRKLEDSLT